MKKYSKNQPIKIHRQQGIALIIVLWMLALMTILALAYSGMARTETILSKNMLNTAKARAEAEAGIWLAVNDLLNPVQQRLYPTTGFTIRLPSASASELSISIQDESGKIDLNKASQQLLLGLFRSVGVDENQASHFVDAILDWRDRDSLARLNGAEDSDYAERGYNYGSKDGPFNSIGELAQVLGITPTLYKKLQPLITVNSMQSRIRLSSASTAVLRTIPQMPEELIAQIVASRSNGETVIIPPILPDIAKPLVFTSGQGNVFSVTSTAVINGITSRLVVTLVLKKNGNRPITLLNWQENAPLSPTLLEQQEQTPENVL